MKLTIPGNPIAKKRAKHAKRGNLTITYDPQQKEKLDVKAKLCALLDTYYSPNEEVKKISEAHYLKVCFTFCLPIPASDSKNIQSEKLWGFQFPATKPDIDNLEKFYLDCANGILWSDDRKVVELSSKKIYGKQTYVKIEIEEKKGFSMTERWSEIIKCFTPDELDIFLHDANNLGVYSTTDQFYASDEIKKEYLETVAGFIAIFVANHAEKIKRLHKVV